MIKIIANNLFKYYIVLMKENINERLRQVRRALGETQEGMAEAMGIGQSTYAQFETGVRFIQPRYIETLRMKFGVNPTWLEDEEGHMFIPSGKEDDIVKRFFMLSESNQELAMSIIDRMIEQQSKN